MLGASAGPAGLGSSGVVRFPELGCQQALRADHIQDSLFSGRGRMGPCVGVYDGRARRRACKAASARPATDVNDLRVDGARVCEPGALHVPGAALAVGAALPPRVEVKNASARPMRSATVRSVKTGFGVRSPQPRRRGRASPCPSPAPTVGPQRLLLPIRARAQTQRGPGRADRRGRGQRRRRRRPQL